MKRRAEHQKIRQGRRVPQLGPMPKEETETEEEEWDEEEWESWLKKSQDMVRSTEIYQRDCMLITNLLSLMPLAPSWTQFIADGWDIARRFLRKRSDFQLHGKPPLVKVGFHFTSSKGNKIKRIQRHGLLPSAGSKYFGKGVYLCENPHAFSCWGDIGILVLYIPGTVRQLKKNEKCTDLYGFDSFRGNKLFKNYNKASKPQYCFDEIIVKSTDQVLPVFAFPRPAVNNADHLFHFHKKVQELADRTINYVEDYMNPHTAPPRKTTVRRVYPKKYDLNTEHHHYKHAKISWQAPTPLLFLYDGTVIQKSALVGLRNY